MDNKNFTTMPHSEMIKKPWGFEVILTPPDYPRTGKILHVQGGERLSLQYHDEKEEVLTLISGRALLWLEGADGNMEKIPMQERMGYVIMPLQKHRVEAVENCEIFEISTPERGTTFRVEDDYSRGSETESMRKQENRGWQPQA